MIHAPAFPFHVLAIDPGGSCGFAELNGPPKRQNLQAWIVENGPWPDEGDPPKDESLAHVRSFCSTWHRNGEAVVICERFHTAQRQNKYSRFTIELIGAIEGICYVYDVPLLLVINKQRRRFIPKAEEILGRKHKLSHDDDDVSALAHLLTFINRYGKVNGSGSVL